MFRDKKREVMKKEGRKIEEGEWQESVSKIIMLIHSKEDFTIRK